VKYLKSVDWVGVVLSLAFMTLVVGFIYSIGLGIRDFNERVNDCRTNFVCEAGFEPQLDGDCICVKSPNYAKRKDSQ
jgi:hypothetical protein